MIFSTQWREGREGERGREKERVRGVYVRKIGTYLCFYERQLEMGGACGGGGTCEGGWSMWVWEWVEHVGVMEHVGWVGMGGAWGVGGACGGGWSCGGGGSCGGVGGQMWE